MRTPARPRLPDGDCVFISGTRIIARTNTPPTLLPTWRDRESPPRHILVHIAFSVSKL